MTAMLIEPQRKRVVDIRHSLCYVTLVYIMWV